MLTVLTMSKNFHNNVRVSVRLNKTFEASTNDNLQVPFQTGFQDHLFPSTPRGPQSRNRHFQVSELVVSSSSH
jgi:hypothetical protein